VSRIYFGRKPKTPLSHWVAGAALVVIIFAELAWRL
jgi:hypothetical protein